MYHYNRSYHRLLINKILYNTSYTKYTLGEELVK